MVPIVSEIGGNPSRNGKQGMRQALRGKASRDEVTDFGDGKKGVTWNGKRRNERGIEYEAVYRELDQSSS